MKLVIFSDMDGTLLDDNYSFKDANEALNSIKRKNVPLVLSSSKTRSELELYRKKMNNYHPFVVENGGAIFIPNNYFSVNFEYDTKKNSYSVIEIGERYSNLRKKIHELRKDFPEIKGFGDMNLEELSEDCGLSLSEAKLAKQREYDEAFKMRRSKWNKAKKIIEDIGLKYTEGGRYYHLLGDNDKGKAVEILSKIYSKEFGEIKTVSLGDSENDVPMFNNTDLHFKVNGPKEWNKKILELISKFFK